MIRRELEIVVISDVHLGTYACHSQELLQYLKSIQPKILVLNGDIMDAEHFKRHLFSNDHLAVIEYLLQMAAQGTKVYYLSGNHDDIMRGYSPFVADHIIMRNHLEFVIDQKKYWIFHGDIFDASVTVSPSIAQIGLKSYKYLIKINRLIEHVRRYLGMSRLSLAKQVKNSVQKALRYVRDFETIIAEHAVKKNYDVVICGHIHVPVIKNMLDGKIIYMNSGDWVENLTALEYQYHTWKIHRYDPADYPPVSKRLQVPAKSFSYEKKLSNPFAVASLPQNLSPQT